MSVLLFVAAQEADPAPAEPAAVAADVPPPSCPPVRLAEHEKQRARTAAFHATRRYPGIVGEVLRAELLAFAEFGYRVQPDSRTVRLIDHLMAPA